MGSSIVITSGKGGTGKTSLTAALASALAASGARVLCIDADIGLRNLDLSLGLSDMVCRDFCDVVLGGCPLEEAVTEHPLIPGLFFLGAPVFADHTEIPHEGFTAMIEEARTLFDWCLVDSPAGLGRGFRLSCCGAEKAVMTVTADDSSRRDAQRAASELYELGITELLLAVNRVRPRLIKRSRATVDDIIDSVGARLIGLVPEDDNVPLAANLGKPLLMYAPKCRAAKAAANMAERLSGRRVPLMKIGK